MASRRDVLRLAALGAATSATGAVAAVAAQGWEDGGGLDVRAAAAGGAAGGGGGAEEGESTGYDCATSDERR